MQTNDYIPGICNINTAEIAYRKKARNIGFITALGLFVLLMVAEMNPFIRAALVFIPLYIGAIGYFQVKNKFCVGYGASGKQNASESSDVAQEVDDAEAKATDKQKARKMNLQALAITVTILLVTLFIPVF